MVMRCTLLPFLETISTTRMTCGFCYRIHRLRHFQCLTIITLFLSDNDLSSSNATRYVARDCNIFNVSIVRRPFLQTPVVVSDRGHAYRDFVLELNM